jgi:hypothetical protein
MPPTTYRKQLGFTAVSWAIWELACVLQVKAIAHQWVLASVMLSLTLPLIGFLSSVWFIEEKSMRRRLGLTAAGAMGAGIGTACIMLFWC